MTLSRRSLFFGAVATVLAAPAIVRAGSLMPVSVPKVAMPDLSPIIVGFNDFETDRWIVQGRQRWVHAWREPMITESGFWAPHQAVTEHPQTVAMTYSSVRGHLDEQAKTMIRRGYRPVDRRPRNDLGFPVLSQFAA